MGEEKNKPKEGELPAGLALVAIILLFEALIFTYHTLPLRIDSVIFFELVFIYVLAVVGIYKMKLYGYYISLFIISITILISIFFIFQSILVLGFLLSVFQLYLLLKNRKHFKEYDKTDKTVFSVAFLSIILYLGFIWWYNSQPTPQDHYQMVSKEAKEKNDITICDKLQEGWRSECIKDFAVAKKDDGFCREINDINIKDNCYLDIASFTGNQTLCDKISNSYERDDCYTFSAQFKNNISICEMIHHANKKEFCINYLKTH